MFSSHLAANISLSLLLLYKINLIFACVKNLYTQIMKVNVEVICNETIKPSSPTPHYLRHYKLSFLDQISPPVFMPLVLFYPKEDCTNLTNLEQSIRIKKSLSEALTRFYPLAGRVKDNLYIDCNDEGVYYVEAKANCQLHEFLDDPIPAELNKFLPLALDDVNDLLAIVQVTLFSCGGIAISLGMSHKVADGLSCFMFLKTWAAIARGHTNMPSPLFDSATLFPPKALTGFEPRTGIVKDNIVTKRFVFDASAIAALRAKYTDNTSIEYQRLPTRVEALSAFIWSRFMATTQPKSDPNKIYTVLHAINLRTRLDPPLPENNFGNISRIAISVPSIDTNNECYDIVNQVRDSIREVNVDYVKKLQESDGHLNFMKERAASIKKGEVVSFSFTSLCRFPIYEADFGWGKPVWVGSASLTFKNLVTFFDTNSGNGIEAWVNLKEEDMVKFERDEELLAYVSSTPIVKTRRL
jgi:shikimate O-hydroxycinnamoyltransferase